MRDGVAPETACESGGGLLRSEIGEHVAGGGEADGVTANDSLVSDILEDHGFADTVWADEHGVVAGLDEAECEELVDGFAVDLLRPGPVEVSHGLERGDARVPEAALEAAFLALSLFDGEDLGEPGLVDDFVGTSEQPEESEGLETSLDFS
jgi:hypothetical protein